MRMIYEEDIESQDFIEIILNEPDYERLLEKGIVKEFSGGLQGKRNLNVYIRVDLNEEEIMPLPKEKKKSKKVISENISELRHSGHPEKQSVAIALSEARGGKKKTVKKGKK